MSLGILDRWTRPQPGDQHQHPRSCTRSPISCGTQVWVGLIFGAGYALGRPEGRAKLAELSKRPEVTQLRQRAASTVSSGAKTGQQQLAHAAHAVKDKASAKLPGKTASGSGDPPHRVPRRAR